MHEMAVCEELVANLGNVAKRENAKRILKVRLEIGCFAGIEIPALRFCYDVVAKNTAAEGSILIIEEVNGHANCFECGNEFEIKSRLDECPNCKSVRFLVRGGDEMKIKDLEIV